MASGDDAMDLLAQSTGKKTVFSAVPETASSVFSSTWCSEGSRWLVQLCSLWVLQISETPSLLPCHCRLKSPQQLRNCYLKVISTKGSGDR